MAKYEKYYDFYEGVVELNLIKMTRKRYTMGWLSYMVKDTKYLSEEGYRVKDRDGNTWWITEKEKLDQFEKVQTV
jgi:hypothetical protein